MSGIGIRLHAFARECKSNHDYLLLAFDYTSGLTTIGPLAANLFEQYSRGNASQNGGKSTCDANKEKVRVEAMGSSSETQRTSTRQELPEKKNPNTSRLFLLFLFSSNFFQREENRRFSVAFYNKKQVSGKRGGKDGASKTPQAKKANVVRRVGVSPA